MRYFGGKAKIAKPLAKFLNEQLQGNQSFVDSFCGSCNVISKIDPHRIRIGNDLHPELIALHIAVQNGQELPDSISEEQYKDIKINGADWLKGFVGCGCSFAGRYFNGYAKDQTDRNYCLNAKNSITKKHSTMSDVIFSNGNYFDIKLPINSLIYCDIPYKNTTKYSTGDFDHNKFYQWSLDRQAEEHTVLVSEYKNNLPNGWEIVWEHESKKSIRNKDGIQETTIEIVMRPISNTKIITDELIFD